MLMREKEHKGHVTLFTGRRMGFAVVGCDLDHARGSRQVVGLNVFIGWGCLDGNERA